MQIAAVGHFAAPTIDAAPAGVLCLYHTLEIEIQKVQKLTWCCTCYSIAPASLSSWILI
jgi:hypothetical protein